MSFLFKNRSIALAYAKFRPGYPKELTDVVVKHLKDMKCYDEYSGGKTMLDAGCGSGQIVDLFADRFDKIIGFDISPEQIDVANSFNQRSNVTYVVGRGEAIPADDSSVDLVISGLAVHWMDIPRFLIECNRVLKPECAVAIIGQHIAGIRKLDVGCDSTSQIVIDQQSVEIDPVVSEYVERFFKTSSVVHTQNFMVFNRYKDVDKMIVNDAKRHINMWYKKYYTLAALKQYFSSIGAYRNYCKTLENPEDDPLVVFSKSVKELWGVTSLPDDEIHIEAVCDIFGIIYPKSSN